MKLKGSKTKKDTIKIHIPRRERSNIGLFSVFIAFSGEEGEEVQLLGDVASIKLSGVQGSVRTSLELTESVSSAFIQFNKPKRNQININTCLLMNGCVNNGDEYSYEFQNY